MKKQTKTPLKGAAALGFQLGATYFCQYWRLQHTITAEGGEGSRAWVESKWADGHVTRHCTPFERGDYLVQS